MRAADTNLVVRLIVRDDDEQEAVAKAFIEQGVWLSHVVLVETAWVLQSTYGRDHSEVADALEMLLNEPHVTIQDPDVVEAALAHYRRRPSLKFTDCLILEIARKAGHLPLGTFDRNFGKLDGTQRL